MNKVVKLAEKLVKEFWESYPFPNALKWEKSLCIWIRENDIHVIDFSYFCQGFGLFPKAS